MLRSHTLKTRETFVPFVGLAVAFTSLSFHELAVVILILVTLHIERVGGWDDRVLLP